MAASRATTAVIAVSGNQSRKNRGETVSPRTTRNVPVSTPGNTSIAASTHERRSRARKPAAATSSTGTAATRAAPPKPSLRPRSISRANSPEKNTKPVLCSL